MTIALMRRYKAVSVIGADGGFQVMLDAEPLQTPAKAPLRLPTQALADVVAAEWAAQDGKLDFTRLPLTQLAMTAQDRPVEIPALLAFLNTELIGHYADDQALAAEQATIWQPLHDWLAQRFGTCLPRIRGIMPSRDPVETGSIAAHLESLDPFRLTAVEEAAACLGSLTIALALSAGRIDPASAVAAAEVESDYQMRRWGTDPDIIGRRAVLQHEIQGIAMFMALLD